MKKMWGLSPKHRSSAAGGYEFGPLGWFDRQPSSKRDDLAWVENPVGRPK